MAIKRWYMGLIKSKRVCEIAGMHQATLSTKILNGSFPQPKIKAKKIYKYDEDEVVKWVEDFEKRVLNLYVERGFEIGEIRLYTKSSFQMCKKVIDKYGAIQGNKKEALENPFLFFLTVSSNLRGKINE